MGFNILQSSMKGIGYIRKALPKVLEKTENPVKTARLSSDLDRLDKLGRTLVESSGNIQRKNVGKHQIPRYIYHLTTQENYENMLKSGSIELHASASDSAGEVIFATELTNLFKDWSNTKGDLFDDNILEKLFKKVGNDKNPNLVMLKIPTSKLDTDSLFLRSQYEYFIDGQALEKSEKINKQLLQRLRASDLFKNYSGKDDFDSMWKYILDNNLQYSKEYEKVCESVHSDAYNTFQQALNNSKGAEIMPATQSKIFEQKNHAIEYIYRKPIPIDIVEASNVVDTSKLRGIFSEMHTKEKSMPKAVNEEIYNIFQQMFAGMPEENAVNNCLKKHIGN